jgi:hypothetical protein
VIIFETWLCKWLCNSENITAVDWHSSEADFPMKDRDRLFLAMTGFFNFID